MRSDRIEGKWIDLFAEVFGLCKVGRHTLGHFDLPLRRCTLSIDGKVVVRDGTLAQ